MSVTFKKCSLRSGSRLGNKDVTTRGIFLQFSKVFYPWSILLCTMCVRTRGILLQSRGKFAPGPCLFPSLSAINTSVVSKKQQDLCYRFCTNELHLKSRSTGCFHVQVTPSKMVVTKSTISVLGTISRSQREL